MSLIVLVKLKIKYEFENPRIAKLSKSKSVI